MGEFDMECLMLRDTGEESRECLLFSFIIETEFVLIVIKQRAF